MGTWVVVSNATMEQTGATLWETGLAFQSLDLPSDYYQGQRHHEVVMPDNVLCWHPHRLDVSEHQHHRFLLMIAAVGSVVVVLDRQMFRLEPGRALLCFPFQVHTFLAPTAERAWLFTTFESDADATLAPLRNRMVAMGEAVARTAGDLARTFVRCGFSNHTCLLTSLLLENLLDAARLGSSVGPVRPGRMDPQTRLVRRVSQTLWRWMDQPVEIERLARELTVSASHLRLIFRTKLGLSLGKYIRQVKIARASELLVSTDLAVAEVAQAVGYGSLHSFSRTFKRETGLCPRAFRDRAVSR